MGGGRPLPLIENTFHNFFYAFPYPEKRSLQNFCVDYNGLTWGLPENYRWTKKSTFNVYQIIRLLYFHILAKDDTTERKFEIKAKTIWPGKDIFQGAP